MINIGNLINTAYRVTYNNSPYRTGNLKNNGISRPATIGDNEGFIKIGGQNAPYGVLLNDEPIIRGKNNKHYGWIKNSFNDSANAIAKEYGGVRIK